MQVKYLIAVGSGKGGVGKSTVATNLALALAAEGVRTGLLDADIYGPSQPMMLGVAEQPIVKNNQLLPIVKYGIQAMSIGYLVDTTAPMVWRGPMVSTALQQLLRDTLWEDVEYLIIDLPPGTGDIQLTLTQKLPLAGAIIVTTPQDIALLDARRAIGMFGKVKVPVVGVVENMSYHRCDNCGHEEAIFGEGGGAQLAQEQQVELLGQLPLEKKVREQMDQGNPCVVADPEGSTALQYRKIAQQVISKMQTISKTKSKFPKIVIQS